MTDLEKAARMALKAMGLIGADLVCDAAHHKKADRHGIGEPCPIQARWHHAFAALLQALSNNVEQPAKQEPVAWRNAALRVGEDLCSVGPFGYYDMTAEQWLDWALSVVTVHAPPASKPWVGMTDEEIIGVIREVFPVGRLWPHGATEFARAIEAKLKEKNIK